MRTRRDRKQQRQLDARVRNATWAGLTKEQKLAELTKRPGKCAKQLAKLNK